MSRNKGWIQVHYVILQTNKCLINSFRYSRVGGLRSADKARLSISNPQHTIADSLGIVTARSSRTPFSTRSTAHTVITLAPPPPLTAFPGAITVPGVWVRASGGRGSAVPDGCTHNLLFSIIKKAPVSPLLQGKLLNSDRKGVSGSVQRHCDSTLSLW